MLYKSVFLGYIAAAAAVVAALVLILIMLHQDRQYERRKLLSLVGVLAGSVCMNTLYFLSFFEGLTSLTSLYAPFERVTDILCSLVINLFLFLFLYYVAKDKAAGKSPAESAGDSADSPAETAVPLAERLFRPALLILICGFLFGGIIYLTVVTDDYTVSSGHLLLAEIGQIVMTAVICLVTVLYTWLAACGGKSSSEDAPADSDDTPKATPRKMLDRLIVVLGIVNIITAIYNAIGSFAMFWQQFDYVDWGGAVDLNTWLFILSDALVLLIVIWFYRRQTEQPYAVAGAAGVQAQMGPVQDAQAAAYAAATEPVIPQELGLTPREEEIASLILQRQTYREIAEQLTISEHTVKRHVHNIYEKAGVSRRDELIRKLRDDAS